MGRDISGCAREAIWWWESRAVAETDIVNDGGAALRRSVVDSANDEGAGDATSDVFSCKIASHADDA